MNWLNEGLLLAPWPQEIEETGRGWPFPGHLPILLSTRASRETRRTAKALSDDLRAQAGIEASVAQCQDDVEGICLGLRDSPDIATAPCPDRAESYGLTVSPNGVAITGSDEAGLAYGTQTFLQLVAFGQERGIVPGVRIRDWPQYPLRAVMLDMGALLSRGR